MTSDEVRILQEQAVAARELREAFDRYIVFDGSTMTIHVAEYAAYNAAFHRVESLRAELAVVRGQAPC